MITRPKELGFVLASAVFLLVVLALLAAFIVRLRISDEAIGGQNVMSSRAYQAARAGIERGLYSVLINGTCPASAQTLSLSSSAVLGIFTVSWTCASVTNNETGATGSFYQIVSTATYGNVASPDYVERQLQVMVEK